MGASLFQRCVFENVTPGDGGRGKMCAAFKSLCQVVLVAVFFRFPPFVFSCPELWLCFLYSARQ